LLQQHRVCARSTGPLGCNLDVHCKIWSFHCGDYEEWCLLRCYAVWLL
jgi:hypothetical protein